MKSLLLSKELYNEIESKCEEFEEQTGHNVEVNDILFSYFNNDDFNDCHNLYVLNDWDEGPNNDKFWNHELNEHSAVVFILRTCEWLKSRKT